MTVLRYVEEIVDVGLIVQRETDALRLHDSVQVLVCDLLDDAVHVDVRRALRHHEEEPMAVQVESRLADTVHAQLSEEVVIVEGEDELHHLVVVSDADTHAVLVGQQVAVERTHGAAGG